MFKKLTSTVFLGLVILSAQVCFAHFGMVIPSTSIVTPDQKNVQINLSFSHPFEGHGMDLSKPKNFFVEFDGKRTNLLPTLKPKQIMKHNSFVANYHVKRPGMYTFFMEPTPYFEPAEDCYIIHYTKTIVSGFNEGEDWNAPLNVKTEIIPLTRPWGNYAGNTFQGTVMLDGKIAPFTRVEVEYYNKDHSKKAPYESMITQEVLTDQNGVFTFTCPTAGWWGFAALNDADFKIKGKDVELGAVLWIQMQ